MKLVFANKISVVAAVATMMLSGLASAQTGVSYEQQLQSLQADAKVDSEKSITQISKAVHDLVEKDPTKVGEVVAAVLAQRSEWSESDLHSVCHAALIGAPDVFQALKDAARGMDTEILHEHGVKAATLQGADLINMWKLAGASLPAGAGESLFNKVMTRLATEGVSFVQHSTYALGILDTISVGKGEADGQPGVNKPVIRPVLPVIPPVTEGK